VTKQGRDETDPIANAITASDASGPLMTLTETIFAASPTAARVDPVPVLYGLNPVNQQICSSTDSTHKVQAQESTAAAVGDGRQKSSRSSHKRPLASLAVIALAIGVVYLVPVSSPLGPDTWGRFHHQGPIACDGRFITFWHHHIKFEGSASFTTSC